MSYLRNRTTLLLAVFLLLAACSGQRGGDGAGTAAGGGEGASAGEGGAGEGQVIELEFPSWQAEVSGFGDWWAELVEAYQQEHPNVTIDLYPIAFDGFVDQMVTRFGAGDPPEIVHLPTRNFAEFASQGWLEPLDDRLEGTDILDTWTPLQEELQWEDSYQGVLLLGYGYVLYYNEQLLQGAGVEVPTTPEDFLAAVETLTTGDVFGFGATTVQAPDNYTEASIFLVGNGGFWTDEAGEFAVTDPGVVRSLQQFRDALSHAPQGVTSEQRVELFNNGQIAMIIDGPFLLPELDSAPQEIRPSLKVARLPFQQVPGGVSNSLHMPAGLDDQTADAVWDFIALASEPQWQERYAELVQVPAPREGSITEEAVAEVPELELFGETTEEAVSVYPENPDLRANFGEFSDAVNQAVIRMTSTQDPTEAVAQDLQAELQDAFGS
jgi:multiple sugar transport system substrate-binding protein